MLSLKCLKFKTGSLLRRSVLILVAYLMFTSCRDKIDLFEIERQGTLSFSTDNIVTQHADDVHFYKGKQVLYYYDVDTYEFYNRYLLEARGKDDKGADVVLSIEIDFLIDQDYIGVYRPAYEYNLGGIYSINLLKIDSTGNFRSYSQDPGFLAEDYLQIEKQSQEEKLILGKFFFRLVCEQDPSEKLTLYQGIFKDIYYAQ
ncbi:MAG: hypothetical protein AB9834_16700 [Lentimicrobium sp.]